MISFKAAKENSKLTDFEDLKDYVVNNTVKSVPRVIKAKTGSGNAIIGSF